MTRPLRLVRRVLLLATALVITLPVMPAGAQDNDDALNSIQQELERLRTDNQAMRAEIDELRLLTDDNWLTEQRAEEIRGLVQDVLADADTRASLQGTGLTAGWSDHFFLASPDGAFKLVLDGKLQFRYLYNYRDEVADRHRAGFENTRTQLTFRGHVFSRDWTYLVRGSFDRGITPSNGGAQPAPSGDFRLLDAWVRYHMTDNWSVRVGQFKAPFTRERLVDSAYIQGPERSNIDIHMNTGRTQGIELTYLDDQNRLSAAFHDGGEEFLFNEMGTLTLSRASNSTALSRDSEFAFDVRYERLIAGTWNQFVDFTSRPDEDFAMMFGLAAHARPQEYEGEGTFGRDEVPWYAWTADLSIEWGGANLFASFNHHYVDTIIQDINIFGIVVQGGIYVTPKWELFARYEHGWWDFDNNTFAALDLATLGANYYIDGHDLKWSTDMGFGLSYIDTNWASDTAGFRMESANNGPQIVFRTQLQLLF